MAKVLGLQLPAGVLYLFLLIITAEYAMMVEGKLCQRQSQTWSGFCGSSNSCDNQCRKWESAAHGACHAQFPGFACFCYFTC